MCFTKLSFDIEIARRCDYKNVRKSGHPACFRLCQLGKTSAPFNRLDQKNPDDRQSLTTLTELNRQTDAGAIATLWSLIPGLFPAYSHRD